MRLLLLFGLLIGIFAAYWPGRAAALQSAELRSARATVSLITDTDEVSDGGEFRAGLHIRLAPGWHTYWRNPGEAGVAPELTLDLPAGAKAGPIEWPAPQRIAEGSVMTYAYTGEVLLPVKVTGGHAGLIQAHASWLVCKQICVPEEGDFQVTLSKGVPAPSAEARLFAAHDRAIPQPSPWQAHIAPNGRLWVQGPELSPSSVVDAWFVPDRSGEIQDSAAQLLSAREGGFILGIKLAKEFDPASGLSGILSVRDRSGQQTDVLLQAQAGPAPGPASPPLLRILAFAFLGGAILNLMPCVFPVLAMKAVAFASSRTHGKSQAHALSYTGGVLVTFAALGGVLLVARAAGNASGWGFQFASPVFVAAISWLLFGVGLNLSGVFQVGTSLSGTGQSLASRAGHVGSFFTGLLAVLVATPCTAPFMSVAIAGGLAAPPAITMLVFVVMGLGLASPYLLLSALPSLARKAPRPGPWMDTLKQALAFPMYGAAAWLLWVISQEAGPSGVLGTAIGFVLLGFAAWALGITQHAMDRARRFGQAVSVAALLAALAVLAGIGGAPAPAAQAGASGTEPFSATRLAALRADGKPVFVNVTAAWCVTCLVNERVAIGTEAVQQAFAAHHVVYLKGDWTRQDPQLTAFLREHGRDGVPLYVYYPPHGQGMVLPQVLTETTVLERIEQG
ncbi:MAG: thioredoxin family protein [Acetobacteraceae bacterium]|nr:thioredoxin family protein [Acetobacteraceae bacterium]